MSTPDPARKTDLVKVVDTANSSLRTLLALFVTAVLSLAGWMGYDVYNGQEKTLKETAARLQEQRVENERLTQENEQKAREIQRLGTALKLLKVDHRLAHVELVRQYLEEPGNVESLHSELTFTEVDDQGMPLEQPRKFSVRGDVVYIDGLVISFDDQYVEEGDPLRGTAVYLFRRLFGEFQEPNDGFSLEPPGDRPAGYSRGNALTEFERELWKNFWGYATDPRKAEAAGVRTAVGKAVYLKLVKGTRYRVMLRSTGDVSVAPEDNGKPAVE